MSADLLAEFGGGSPPSDPKASREQHTSTSLFAHFEPAGGSGNGLASIEANAPDSEEDWSDFHSGEAPKPDPTSEAQDEEELWHQDPFGNDVLFDAATEEVPEDDDWGDFETANSASAFGEKQISSPARKKPTDIRQNIAAKPVALQKRKPSIPSSMPKTVDLLSDNDDVPVHKPQTASPARNVHVRSFSKSAPKHGKQASVSHVVPKLPDLDDEWGDFADAAPENPSANLEAEFQGMNLGKSKGKATHASQGSVSKPRAGSTLESKKSTSGPAQSPSPTHVDIRPVNIPPPFIILQIFTPLLEQFEKRIPATNRSQGNSKEVSKSTDSELAHELVSTLKMAARVITGRTLRWTRDTALSQSTKIGPARSGKSGGMKLNSVNKGESIKEEKEAMDVLEAWRSRAGRFNSVILAAGHQVPLITNNMRARPANADEGALKASHACALCGLRRDERIPKIDEKVEDSFGEWWTEHWGHTDCKNFWDRNSRSLNQRY
ncbi:hypothetical protein FQN54_003598 [Arachnomyces sp. PD_36]|nr:hypothetical protein FQN54_003598 [Arachnomyces sp. PD_36]